MPDKKYISSIQQNSQKYYIKDLEARDDIDELKLNDLKCRDAGNEILEFYYASYTVATNTDNVVTTSDNEPVTTTEE